MRYFRDINDDYPSWQLLDNGDLQFRYMECDDWEVSGLSLAYVESAPDVEECDADGRPLTARLLPELMRMIPQPTYTMVLELMDLAERVIDRHDSGTLGCSGDSVAVYELEHAVTELRAKLSDNGLEVTQ